jgi:tRNA pseudouridine55 synthase
MNGILAVDKPKGLTSHDVVARVRRLFGQRRVGHAGTLDPMATGVLVVCLGDATRMSDDLMHGTKWYLARVVLGIRTDTDDAMGEVLERRAAEFSHTDLEWAARSQVGRLEQIPPKFAAIKQQGRPAYKAARAGETVTLTAREVVVHSLAVLATRQVAADPGSGIPNLTLTDLLISCSKGTYIRSIARDLGAALGCGGHLSGLRRLASGAITTNDCVTLAELERLAAVVGRSAPVDRLLPLDYAVNGIPAALLGIGLVEQARSGRVLALPPAVSEQQIRLYGEGGELVATAHSVSVGGYHPDRVFPGAAL